MRSLFGRKSAEAQDASDGEPIWALPDMECVESPEISTARGSGVGYQYEEPDLHPAGTFTAELTGHRRLEGQRVAWRFRTVPANELDGARYPTLDFVTGTVCRPDNNLSQLLTALGLVPTSGAEPAAARDALGMLDTGAAEGRQCRIRVEHVRDELGDVTARITGVMPGI